MMPGLEVRFLKKSFDKIRAVQDFSHAFAQGKITTVVGPSGCGKSTLLGMIVGLMSPDYGSIILDGQDITLIQSEERNMGMIFQNYALFPHLTVRQNIEFGLRVRRWAQEARKKHSDELLERLRIPHLANRYISQISQGEQQRVALARALAIRPRVLLLDEPLSALDAKLREELRAELFQVLNEESITSIYVTHDHVEALSLGHELIVMNAGGIEQCGKPLEVYMKPSNPFVAEFFGTANIFEGESFLDSGQPKVRLPFAVLPLSNSSILGPCKVLIRTEDLLLSEMDRAHFTAEYQYSQFLGRRFRLFLNASGHKVILDADRDMKGHQSVGVQANSEKILLWKNRID